MAIGGKTQIRVIVASNVPHNWTEMDGCVNGPFNGTVKDQVMAMLTSADLR